MNSDDSKPTGLIDATDKPNHFGLALKHFAYFVRPGFTRVDATAQPLDGVSLSAYGGTGGQAVIVLINDGSADRTLSVAVTGPSPAAWTPYRTSATESFAKLPNLTASAGSFGVTLPAKSITTLVNAASQ